MQEIGDGPVGLAFPGDAGDAGAGDRDEAEGEGRGRGAEVALGGGEDAPIGVVGVGGEEEAAAGGADDADAAAAAVERVGGARLVEVADGNDGDAGALGEATQSDEGAADGLLGVGAVSGKEGEEGIDDEKRGVGAGDEIDEKIDVVWQGEGFGNGVPRDVISESEHAAGISARGVDAGADGVVDVVLGGHDDDEARRTWLAAGEGLAAGDAGGEVAEEGGLAEAGIAVEEGDLAGGEAAGGEPADGLGGNIVQADEVVLAVAPAVLGRRRFGWLLDLTGAMAAGHAPIPSAHACPGQAWAKTLHAIRRSPQYRPFVLYHDLPMHA